MTTKPAKKLPLRVENGINIMAADGKEWNDREFIEAAPLAFYIVHACNNLPRLEEERAKLVEALRGARTIYSLQALRDADDPATLKGWRDNIANLDALLRSLGEL